MEKFRFCKCHFPSIFTPSTLLYLYSMTVQASYRQFYESLHRSYALREARQMADRVYEKVTGLSPTARIVTPETELMPVQEKRLARIQLDLLDHIPLQYVLNEAWFFKHCFAVDKNVLIPRPETEELVEWVLQDIKDTVAIDKALRLLDVGTGSGCIAISIKKENQKVEMWAMDQSEGALKIARKNATDLQVEIHFIQADLLQAGWERQIPVMDVLVSNPPYIPISEKKDMDPNVAGQEPDGALFVPDEDPFIFYKAILQLVQKKLRNGGKVYVELHEEYGKEIKKLFSEVLEEVTLRKDLNGRDRMVSGRFSRKRLRYGS